MIKIITHDRIVHADDTFAAAMLRLVFGAVNVQRTRDPDVLRTAAGTPGTYLLDIGGRYDPAQGLFDHHQPEGAGFRDTYAREWPYATAGLVWKEFGARVVRQLHPALDDRSVQEVVDYIDDTLLKFIDAVDCGVRLKNAGPSVSALIASFNRNWFETDEDVFPLVMDLAQVLLVNFINRYAGKVLARDQVRQARQAFDGQVLVLDACIPWTSIVAEEMPQVLLVVYPVGDSAVDGQWHLRTAMHETSMHRIQLPHYWGGLERQALTRVCGEPDAVFCHRSRHLAGARSLDAALRMAQTALNDHFMYADRQAA